MYVLFLSLYVYMFGIGILAQWRLATGGYGNCFAAVDADAIEKPRPLWLPMPGTLINWHYKRVDWICCNIGYLFQS